MRNLKKVLSITAAAAMAVSTVTPVSVFAESEETFKIGVIGPMTGDYAQYGNGVYNAARSQQMRSMQTADSMDIR